MTKKDFLRLVIKLFGLYGLVLTLFHSVPSLFTYSISGFDIWLAIYVLVVVAVTVAIYALLIRNVDLLIRWLRLDQGFDDDQIIIGNFDGLKLVSFAVLIIGGLLFIDYFPSFIYNCYFAFKEHVGTQNELFSLFQYETAGVQYFDWAIATMNLIIGYLLIMNYSKVARWVMGVNKKNENQ
ncbi:hypothetical protein KFE98_10370 [bacterium SCSIO 12741]|nr:hypothetical protein KFE98_10370 [bacterium SCSIO 12741]